ncbi:AraC family transcriptional regulator [Sulfitobacter aestuariivivens]|uniref:AraC family transcriptional regulator n=1 Tax=Sulfitobacter aestuariivivens TaxID=2766981 RepID=UPI00361E2C97
MSKRIGFFVPPQVSLLGLDCALDTLRVANRVRGDDFYRWCTIGEADHAVQTSNDLRLALDYTMHESLPELDMLFVCGSIDPAEPKSARTVPWLRYMSRRVPTLGGITSGAFLLARAGLLDGYTCTVHWENADLFRQEFPDIRVSDAVFVIDRDRMTSAGGF